MRLYCFLIVLLLPFGMSAQVTMSPNVVNFFTVFTGEADTIPVTITNNSPTDFIATDVQLFEGDAFRVDQTAFVVPTGGSFTFHVICEPVQNVRTGDQLIVRSSSHPLQLNAFVFAFVRHLDSYYDGTFDLWHEDLKAALTTLISFGYTDLGYNPARDRVFEDIDNEAVNGQGATQNTLTCPYTGTQAVGFANRPDAQTTFSFNTEHTFPQGQFNQLQPMRSDMHHLYAVTENSNTQRSNKPFGVVTNPSWQVGGSKANGSTFEPRDAAKGDIARAMMYFVLRYQDFNGFMAPQETVLRQWNKQFAPDSVDIARNDLIEGYQNNRNPFIDHPEFCDRIASIATVDSGPSGPVAWFVPDTLNYGDVGFGTTMTGTFSLSNQGFGDLIVTNQSTNHPDYVITNTAPVFGRDDRFTYQIDYTPTGNGGPSPVATFTTNDPAHPTIQVPLDGTGVVTSRPEIAYLQQARLYPAPAADQFRLAFSQALASDLQLTVIDLQGKSVLERFLLMGEQVFEVNVGQLEKGVYLVRLSDGAGQWTHKLLIQ